MRDRARLQLHLQGYTHLISIQNYIINDHRAVAQAGVALSEHRALPCEGSIQNEDRPSCTFLGRDSLLPGFDVFFRAFVLPLYKKLTCGL